MRTFGGILIFAAVCLRAVVVFADNPAQPIVYLLLLFYGLFLLSDAWSFSRCPSLPPGSPLCSLRTWFLVLYLSAQTVLAQQMLYIYPVEDFFALLFIPLSLQAVLYFGRRTGFYFIAAYSLVMSLPLLTSQDGWLYGLAMTILYTGMCTLFGGYAHQVVKAEAARHENQRTLAELQAAHSRLLDYAAQREEMAAEGERSRLARELHDSVTQTVFSMNLASQSARLLLPRDLSKTDGQLQQIGDLAASAMREIQTLVSQLRPTPAVEAGLPLALRRLIEDRRLRDSLQVQLELFGDRQFPEAVAQGLYRIVQEALTNVVRHSKVAQAVIRLDISTPVASLEIEDQGCGFDPQAAFSQRGHLGLVGMAERAREIGWEFSIDSQPGRGARLHLVERSPGGIG